VRKRQITPLVDSVVNIAIVMTKDPKKFLNRHVSDCCWRSADRLIELGADQADIETIKQAFGPYHEAKGDNP
jgi:hypothetical protein